MDDIDTLYALDWQDYHCQWWMCRSLAKNEVHTHVVDICTDRDHADMFGNSITLLCEEHTTQLKSAAARRIARLNQRGRSACKTCGAPVVNVTDVVRETTPLLGATMKGFFDDRQ